MALRVINNNTLPIHIINKLKLYKHEVEIRISIIIMTLHKTCETHWYIPISNRHTHTRL